MAKRKQNKGFAQKKAAEAANRQAGTQRRTSLWYTLGFFFIVAPLLALLSFWLNQGGDPEPAAQAEPAAAVVQAGPVDMDGWTLVESDRPLADLDPAERADIYNGPPEIIIDPDRRYRAVMRTEKGDITLDLFATQAPITVNNFVYLANQGFYDDTTFHRVIPDFMAQAGDPLGAGFGGPGYRFEDEFDPELSFNRRGLLAMANSGPATNGSQFFITFVPTPHLDGRHTIFGEMVGGDDALSAIRFRDPNADPNPGDRIERIDIYTADG